VFDFVPEIGTQGEFERGGNMPGDESDRGENPADQRMGENFSKGLLSMKDVIFYFSMIFFALFLTSRSMESLRWRS